ncbi:FAD/FMN-containing dehydrogenase [Amycolatopsis xylanica]|uniref:FAD/FMN-containing dehydrogenase n=1 Tax=Amycolatopsis xylanica TaxID=589385 RepID=A0A1H3FWT1_9PSEU|nr:FAD-binding oxidoreductase [Amycolatopsis xylanica]SDX95563.1 FAD/FMN-containing dehydrogenase [Amycolatopsis xylanica]
MTTAGFSRRKFLATTAGAAVVGTGLLAATGARATAGGIDFDGLGKAMSGRLLRPGDTGYDFAATTWNLALPARRPAAIALVADRQDVIECVRRAGGRGTPLAARSGGHSYAGFSTPDGGVVVDVSELNKITVRDDGTAVVGSGAQLMQVYSALAARGRALPGGTCATVGIAGLTLGGGIGPLTRPYGLTCDRLRGATVVTADGAVHQASAHKDTDLFWALRGGGGGHAGIVTEFTFSTVPAPNPVVFKLEFPASHTAKVLAAWSAWQHSAPKELTSTCAIGAGKEPSNSIEGTWAGKASAAKSQLDALVSEVGVAPSTRTSTQKSYLDTVLHFAPCKEVSTCYADTKPGGTVPREAFHAASRMLPRVLKAADATRVVEIITGFDDMVLLFDAVGGEVDAIGARDTAYGHRGARASVQIYGWSETDKGEVLTQAQQALTRVLSSASYVNYVNPLQTDWATSYWGVNQAKLRRVVSAYDPGKVFDFPHSALRG